MTEEKKPIYADRSTLERYMTCPLSARLHKDVKSAGIIAAVGSEVHRAISAAIVSYVESHYSPGHSVQVRDLREIIESESWQSRADVQPQAVRAVKYGMHLIANVIGNVNPQSILAFDGGDDVHVPVVVDGKTLMRSLSGQMEYDIPLGNETIRLTGEVDFLHSTKVEGLLKLHDWKSGWKTWSEDDVADSFQFQIYALMVLGTYEDVERVDVIIHDTRKNKSTMPTPFVRSDMGRLRMRVMSAIGDWYKNSRIPIESVEARPSREGCRLCDAASLCRVCDKDIKDIKTDPAAAVDRLYVLQRAIEEIEETLKIVVIEKGSDIVTESGNAYGIRAPKREMKPKSKLYQPKVEESE